LKYKDEYLWQKEWLPIVSSLTDEQINCAILHSKFKSKGYPPSIGEFVRMAHGLLEDELAYFYARRNPDYYEYIRRAAYEAGMLNSRYRKDEKSERISFFAAYEVICRQIINGAKFVKSEQIEKKLPKLPSFAEFKLRYGLPSDLTKDELLIESKTKQEHLNSVLKFWALHKNINFCDIIQLK